MVDYTTLIYASMVVGAVLGIVGIWKDYLFKKPQQKNKKAEKPSKSLPIFLTLLIVISLGLQGSSQYLRDEEAKFNSPVGTLTGMPDNVKYPSIVFGSNPIDNTNNLVKIDDDVITAYVVENKLYISLYLRNEKGEIVTNIQSNEFVINDPNSYDKNYDSNAFEILNKKTNQIIFQAIMYSDHITINGEFYGNKGSHIYATDDGLFIGTHSDFYLTPLFKYPSLTHPHERI